MKQKPSWKLIVGIFVFTMLLLSIFYSVMRIITTPSETPDGLHERSDYVLMLLQCALGLLVIGLPSFLERKWSFAIPNYMSILYFIFLSPIAAESSCRRWEGVVFRKANSVSSACRIRSFFICSVIPNHLPSGPL